MTTKTKHDLKLKTKQMDLVIVLCFLSMKAHEKAACFVLNPILGIWIYYSSVKELKAF